MIVYMIMDDKTGRWWRGGSNNGWKTKQEEASIWGKEGHATQSLRRIQKVSRKSNPVKMRFVLAPVIEGASWPDVVVVGEETWVFDPDFDSWFWGEENNGCGVYPRRLDDKWEGNVVVKGDVTMLSPQPTRDEAMMAAIAYWRKNNDE